MNKGLFTTTLFAHHLTTISQPCLPLRWWDCALIFRLFITLWFIWA